MQVPCRQAGRDSCPKKMITLYVIRSEKNNALYVGICKSVENRLKEHNHGKNRYTKGLMPWVLVHTESFPDWGSAREKEKYYKSGFGKENLKAKLALRKPSESLAP